MKSTPFSHFWISRQNKLKRYHLNYLPVILKRNKGFILRKGINRISDVLEFLFLALLAEPSYLKSIIAIFLFVMTLNIIDEWFYISSKELAIQKKKHSKKFAFSFLITSKLVLIPLFLTYYHGHGELMAILLIIKIATQSMQTFTLYQTIDIQSQKRIYVSLVKTNGPFIASQLILWTLFFIGGHSKFLFYLALISFSLSTFISEVIYYKKLTTPASAYEKWKKPIKSFKAISIIESLSAIIVKNAAILDLIALSWFVSQKTEFKYIYSLIFLISFHRLLVRPYRSLLIDLQRIPSSSPYENQLLSQSLILSLIILGLGIILAIPYFHLKVLSIIGLWLLKTIITVHRRNKKSDIISFYATALLFVFLTMNLQELILFLVLALTILAVFFKGKKKQKIESSKILLIPLDEKIKKTIPINQINFQLKHYQMQIEKIIPGQYICLRVQNDYDSKQVLMSLSYYIDNKKNERILTSSHDYFHSIKTVPLIQGAKIKFIQIDRGDPAYQLGDWSSNELIFISYKSRYLNSQIWQLGRKALYHQDGLFYYMISHGEDQFSIFSSPSFTDSELEQLDEIKLKSLV